MRRALAEYQVRGIRTTIPFFQWVLDDEDFKAARFDTGFIDRKLGQRAPLQADRCRRTRISRRSPPRVHLFTKPVADGDARRAGAPAAGAMPAATEALR